MTSQVILHISKEKGDKASSLIKAFVAAAQKLTDVEYNSLEVAKKPLMAVVDAVAEEQAIKKPNPFRKNAPG